MPRSISSLEVWVQPRASKNEVVGLQGGAIKIRVAAPPVDGEANAALVRYLAKALGVPRSAVVVARGQTGRRKLVHVEGLDQAETLRRLGV